MQEESNIKQILKLLKAQRGEGGGGGGKYVIRSELFRRRSMHKTIFGFSHSLGNVSNWMVVPCLELELWVLWNWY
jgi:hypothetical protein